MSSTYFFYAVCRGTVAFIWFYQGLVPKILFLHEDELAMSTAAGLSQAGAIKLATIGGALEIAMSVAVLLFWRQRWPLLLTVAAMIVLLALVCMAQPILLVAAFNPLTINIAMAVLSMVSLHFLRLIKGEI